MASIRPRTKGPLRVYTENPRYFADATGKPLLLTGSHTWATVQDYDPDHPFDFPAMLTRSAALNHSFIRFWAWEQARWAAHTERDFRFSPVPFQRTGPGEALDGGPKFDLSRFDERYFARLRDRVVLAAEHGLYVGVMLFQGWSVEFKTWGFAPGVRTWTAHPFHRDNNVNGIDGDPDNTNDGLATHTLAVPGVFEVQRAFVRRVVETLHDQDNVIFEVSNESAATPESRDWQYAILEEIRAHEQRLVGMVHPTWMTAMWPATPEVNDWLRASPAEAISPSNLKRYVGLGDDYIDDPPPGDGRKVVIIDTDHVWGIGGDVDWVWRSFMRGLNPIFMDPWDGDFVDHPPYGPGARQAMGIANTLASQVNLGALRPAGDLVSSGFALADPDREVLLAFQPGEGKLTVDLRGTTGSYRAVWQHSSSDSCSPVLPVEAGQIRQIASPYCSSGVLVLRKDQG